LGKKGETLRKADGEPPKTLHGEKGFPFSFKRTKGKQNQDSSYEGKTETRSGGNLGWGNRMSKANSRLGQNRRRGKKKKRGKGHRGLRNSCKNPGGQEGAGASTWWGGALLPCRRGRAAAQISHTGFRPKRERLDSKGVTTPKGGKKEKRPDGPRKGKERGRGQRGEY